MSEYIITSAKDLKKGKYVIIDGLPCKVVAIDVSKPGKHGAAKMKVTGIGIFNNQKKVLLTPSDAEVKVPIIKKYNVQVLAVMGDTAQVMNKDTYEVFEVQIPNELKGEISEGKDAEIMEAMGQKLIIRIYKEE